MCYSTLALKQDDGIKHVPCGRCVACLQRKRAEWTFRLMQELRYCKSATFLTLTYDDEHLPPSCSLEKQQLQNFMKRLRKQHSKKSNSQLRYYAVGEYGTKTRRPHYHLILFNLSNSLYLKVEEIWGKGNIRHDEVNQATIHYVTKYVVQVNLLPENLEKPFALMSKRPYLGHKYVERNTNHHRQKDDLRCAINNIKMPLPRIYKNKMFSKIELQVKAIDQIKKADQAEFDLTEKAAQKGIDIYERVRQRQLHEHAQLVKQSKSM